jgi:hypothetical protein
MLLLLRINPIHVIGPRWLRIITAQNALQHPHFLLPECIPPLFLYESSQSATSSKLSLRACQQRNLVV